MELQSAKGSSVEFKLRGAWGGRVTARGCWCSALAGGCWSRGSCILAKGWVTCTRRRAGGLWGAPWLSAQLGGLMAGRLGGSWEGCGVWGVIQLSAGMQLVQDAVSLVIGCVHGAVGARVVGCEGCAWALAAGWRSQRYGCWSSAPAGGGNGGGHWMWRSCDWATWRSVECGMCVDGGSARGAD